VIDALSQALFHPDTAYLAGVVLIAGVVRGFAGFGVGLIVVPLASRVLPPLEVLTLIMILDVASGGPLWPRMRRDIDFSELRYLVVGLLVFLPVGLFLLSRVDPEVFRWQASILALALVGVMATSWRHSLVMGRNLLVAVGGVGGFLGGVSGIPGPPVILAYLTGRSGVARIRATIFAYLLAYDVYLGLLLLLVGAIALPIAVLCAVLFVPYTLGNLLGARIFNPAHDRLYRRVAYVIITLSALTSLPIWD
jgi:uncharacterized membrane protein YfcA